MTVFLHINEPDRAYRTAPNPNGNSFLKTRNISPKPQPTVTHFQLIIIITLFISTSLTNTYCPLGILSQMLAQLLLEGLLKDYFMNTGLLTNMLFTTSLDVIPAPSRTAALGKNGQSSSRSKPNTVDNSPCDNAPEATTTDNTITVARNEPIDKSPQDFRHALGKKISAETPKNDSANTKSESQVATAGADGQQNSAQPEVAQAVVTLTLGKTATFTKEPVKPKTSQEPGQLLTSSKKGKFPSTDKQIVKSVEDKLLPTIGIGQPKAKTVSTDNFANAPATDAQQTEGKTEVKIQTPNKTPDTTNSPTNKQSDKELMSETSGTDNKTATASQKQAESNDSVIETQDKSSTTQQKVPVDVEKSATTVTKQTGNKANTTQQDQKLSESPAGNDKGSHHTGKNPSSDSLLNNFNASQVQVSTEQAKHPANSSINNNPSSDSGAGQFEQVLSADNPQPSVAEQTSSVGPAISNNSNASPNNAFADISEQIQEYISSSVRQGDQRVTIHLNPPELGKVFIKFQEEGDQITGLLEVSKMQTRYQIQQALPQIVRNLADSGIQIKRLEVVLADQAESQTYKDQLLQDGSFYQHGSAEKNNSNNMYANEWMTNIDSYQNTSEQQDMFVTDKSINILI